MFEIKPLKIITTLIVVFFLAFLVWHFYLNNWNRVIQTDNLLVADGWSQPIDLSINTSQWESSAFISNDGNTLYFSYYPGDYISNIQTGEIKNDLDIYYSIKPFEKKEIHPVSESKWSESGIMFSDGDVYYASDRNNLGISSLYKNGKILDYSDNLKSESNPYYCAEKSEMYFDIDGVIYVYKNGSKEILSQPINDGNNNIQPFLSHNCQIMYFVSDRNKKMVSAIYTSKRMGENSWSEPELVIESNFPLESPSLTEDGNKLFFVQIFTTMDNSFNADIFYIEKIK